MTRFGKLHRVFHRFPIPNLADEDDIRRLAQGILQGNPPTLRIHPHFALRDDAVHMGMNELHRILDRDDVTLRMGIAIAHHGGEGCRLS